MSKLHIAALLTTTLLTNCGDSNNDNSANNTSGQNASSSNSSSLASKAILANATTVDDIMNLSEVQQKVDSLKSSWSAIKDKKASEKDAMTSTQKKQFIQDYKTFWDGIYEINFATRDAILHQFPNFSTIPGHDSSWRQMTEFIRNRATVSEQLHKIPDSIYHHFDIKVAGLGAWPNPEKMDLSTFYAIIPENPEEESFVKEIDTWRSLYSKQINTFLDQKRIFGYDNTSSKILDEFAEAKIAKTDLSTLRKIPTLLTEKGYLVRTDDTSLSALITALSKDALILRSFRSVTYNKNGDPAVPWATPLSIYLSEGVKSLATSLEEVREKANAAEKIIVSEMIKSNQFAGLFDYLRGKEFTFGEKKWVAFSIEEFDALVPVASAINAGHALTSTSARRGVTGGDTSNLTLNGISGSKLALNLPIYVELKGNLDSGKATSNLYTSVAYKVGNTTTSINHAYANTGAGFESSSDQHETTVAVAQSMGNFFVEASLGRVEMNNIHFTNWAGTQTQLTLGFDTQYITPYVQFAYRDLSTRTDMAGYLGADLRLDTLTVDSGTLEVALSTHFGYQEREGVVGELELSGKLNLDSGIGFSSNLKLGSKTASEAGVSFSLNR